MKTALSILPLAAVGLAAPALQQRDYVLEKDAISVATIDTPNYHAFGVDVNLLKEVISDEGQLVSARDIEVTFNVELAENLEVILNGKPIGERFGYHREAIKAQITEWGTAATHVVDVYVALFVGKEEIIVDNEVVDKLFIEAKVVEVEDSEVFQADVKMASFVVRKNGEISAYGEAVSVEASHSHLNRVHASEGASEAQQEGQNEDNKYDHHGKYNHHSRPRTWKCRVHRFLRHAYYRFNRLPFVLRLLIAGASGMCLGFVFMNTLRCLCSSKKSQNNLAVYAIEYTAVPQDDIKKQKEENEETV